jgi:hypothetical protein
MANDGTLVSDQTQVKKILDLVRTSCKGHAEPISHACSRFNEATDEGKNMRLYSSLLDQAIRSMVSVKEERDIDSLFISGKTTALVDSISGLEDFELINFLVIQD